MEEKEYKNTYQSINERRCVFEKTINSRRCTCKQSQRFHLADREGIACKSASGCRAAKSVRNNQHDCRRQFGYIKDNNQKTRCTIKHSHNRNEKTGYISDSFNTAYYDGPDTNGHYQTNTCISQINLCAGNRTGQLGEKRQYSARQLSPLPLRPRPTVAPTSPAAPATRGSVLPPSPY